MKILITGGLGTVGNHLVKELRARDHDVLLCDLPHHHDPQYYRCDVGEYRQFQRIFDDHEDEHPIDCVYHLAAEFGRWNGEDYYETLWRTNTIGTKHLIRLQEKHGFRLVHFSSSEVYGDYDGVMEEGVMDKVAIQQMNDYAMTKWVNEMQIRNSELLNETQTVRVRLFNTYGPGEHYSSYRSVICLFCYHALHRLPYTVYLNHTRTSTYIEDTVRALAEISNHFTVGEVYNIGGKTIHDIKTVSDIVLGHTGASEDLVTYKEAEKLTTRHKRVDITKAERDLGLMETVTLEDGIERTLEWMRSVYDV